MSIPTKVNDHAPILKFSKGEQYFPCKLFFAGKDILKNREEYEKLSESKKKEKVCCYYHVNEGQTYTVYQYWYYYAFNKYARVGYNGDHAHDFECFKVFVDKETEKSKVITCNIHLFRELTKIDESFPDIKVERGGHGLFTKNISEILKIMKWRWESGEHNIQVLPKESCEELRSKMMPLAPQLIDTELKLIGRVKDSSTQGRTFRPEVPWTRSEYYLPEKTLLPDKLLDRIGYIILPQWTRNLRDAITIGRRCRVVTKQQYETLQREGVQLEDEEKLQPIEWWDPNYRLTLHS